MAPLGRAYAGLVGACQVGVTALYPVYMFWAAIKFHAGFSGVLLEMGFTGVQRIYCCSKCTRGLSNLDADLE